MARIDPKHGGLVWDSDLVERNINLEFNPVVSTLPLEEKVRRSLSVGVECIFPEELEELFRSKTHPVCYDGFEPSGRMHIAQGLLKAINVNKLTSSGCIFIFWVADWFAMLNNKMGGDLTKIRLVGKYMIETWRAAGMDMRNVKFLWCSEEINKKPNEYWERVMDIAMRNNITRLKRCGQIMGREESGKMPAAQILYPIMQCSDIFFLKADICQLGLDQRKVNVLAREYCDQIKQAKKPVILSHPMLMGLKKDQEKMSKSDPGSAIFMQDSQEDVVTKINKAYCEPGDIEKNPVLNYTKHIIFGSRGELLIKRAPENGGDTLYNSYEALEADFAAGRIHPGDLKPAVSGAINSLLDPIRRHFQTDPYARSLYEQVAALQVTR
ncbi:unnamed protein product [Blepharisma stoltei]|uniref:tyrosine--tRNA ligase n=1 Tax=Blepharisma stoltei TaxID=1481888 RepID=A0AAU9KDN5_9CILI|nr:unnamed protein product [Blepharisma stoltei]